MRFFLLGPGTSPGEPRTIYGGGYIFLDALGRRDHCVVDSPFYHGDGPKTYWSEARMIDDCVQLWGGKKDWYEVVIADEAPARLPEHAIVPS